MAATGLPQPGSCALAVARRASSSRQTARDVQGAAAEHLRRCEQEGGAVEVLGEDLAPLDAAIQKADLVIDALLGTGLRGAPRPAMARVIERIAHGEKAGSGRGYPLGGRSRHRAGSRRGRSSRV